jgi:enoyl-[acyl-carrier protein] reductase II
MLKPHINIPIIAAGGIGTGATMAAAFCLGAQAVQVGSRFVATPESSAHQNFKQSVIDAKDGQTQLTLKEITPVRLIKNGFYEQVQEAYKRNASVQEISNLLGRGRAKKGMHLGDLEEGELEIGQISAYINELKPAADIVNEMMVEFKQTIQTLNSQF